MQNAESWAGLQTLPPQYVDVLCRTCAWAPNRVIGLVVHKYWVNRLSRAAALSRPHSALLASSPSATLADTLLGMSFLGPNKPASVVRQLSIDLSSSQTHQVGHTSLPILETLVYEFREGSRRAQTAKSTAWLRHVL